MSTNNTTSKIKLCDLLTKLDEKIKENEEEYYEKLEELENEENDTQIEILNDEIFELLEDSYFLKNVIKQLNKKQHYKALSRAK